MNKVYSRINWENEPSANTPINETNLNKMDFALNEVDNRLIEQDTTKLSKTDASNDVVNWTMDEDTGVITVTRRNGEKIIFDLNIEKIPVSFSLSDDGILTMITDDGTTFTANIGAMIPIITFEDSDEIYVSVSGTGINKTYSFSIKDNSITENKLQPNFLSDIKVQSASASLSASNAETSATQAQSYAVGGTGTRENEDTDNAMYYYEQAKKTDISQISLKVDEINRNLYDQEFLGWQVPSECPVQNSYADGVFTQRVGRVDLGSLNWKINTNYGVKMFVNNAISNAKKNTPNVYINKNYSVKTSWSSFYVSDKAIIINDTTEVRINDNDYSDVTSFKNAMQGVYLYYELATPITIADGHEAVTNLKNDLSASNAGAHNSVYRGKYLGNALTTEQKAQISAGTFNDLYIGDYWTIGGVNYRIASFDYWLNSGDTNCTTHHVVIVPDTCLYNAQMNTSNITTGAYVGSAMYTSNLEQANTIINNAFGSENILSHREHLANATKSTTDPTYESAGSWYDSTVEIMNERMVYGADVFHNIEVNGAIPANYTIDKSQLPLFALEPSRICNRAYWWLRDVVSAAYFAIVNFNGHADYYSASNSFGVRPAFGIKG